MRIINVLQPDDCARLLRTVQALPFDDGSSTAFGVSRSVKRNAQARADHPTTVSLVTQMTEVLSTNDQFIRTAFPRSFCRITFCRYEVGDHYGEHLDLPLMGQVGSDRRTDMSFTLCLSSPEDYGGGELTLHTGVGTVDVKLDAGSLVLYETSCVHAVRPVTHGTRYVMIGWVESHIGGNELRSLTSAAYDLSAAIGVGGTGYEAADRLAQGLLRFGAQS